MGGHDEGEADLTDLLRRAADLVSAVPVELRPAAYSWVLDYYTNGANRATPAAPLGRKSPKVKSADPDGDNIRRLMDTLVRTNHPEIAVGKKALDLALAVLRAAKAQAGVDWLTPQEISGVLKDKFGIKTEAPAVRMALKSSDYVDRRQLPNGAYKYRIMAAGEDYLDSRRQSDG